MLFSKENAHFAKNPASLEMLPLLKLAQSVQREKHLFYGILRFQEVGENFFFAEIEPKYDILQLLANHFQRRFKKQQWVIFDSSRQYGLYYNLEAVDVIFIENFTPPEKQDQFTSFWQTYYKSAIIEERLNKRQFRRMLRCTTDLLLIPTRTLASMMSGCSSTSMMSGVSIVVT